MELGGFEPGLPSESPECYHYTIGDCCVRIWILNLQKKLAPLNREAIDKALVWTMEHMNLPYTLAPYKNQHNKRKFLYFVNRHSAEVSKIGHLFRK